MFEPAEQKFRVSRAEFASREEQLHPALLTLQRQLQHADFPVIIVVSGVEGAGKGDVVRLLNKWFDVRGLQTHAFWEETDDERLRPRFWRFWRALPARGQIGILFGSWYTEPVVRAVLKGTGGRRLKRELARIREFEQMLADDGALIIKFWFHLSAAAQARRLREDKTRKPKSIRISPLTRAYARHYRKFREVSEHVLRRTDTDYAGWHVVAAENPRHRDLQVGEIVRAELAQRLAAAPEPCAAEVSQTTFIPAGSSRLATVDLERRLDDKRYHLGLKKYQNRLYELTWKAKRRGISTVAVFEGWDAAGKGGAIRRVTQAMDARLYRVISIAAPSDEEAAQHYLWRFWRHLPRAGYHTIYDRSWYGRVLVERVEGFAADGEWQRAYNEINAFEEQLTDAGTVVLKFWLHIDPDEQLARFREREQVPWKHHKITEEDWRNRERWPDYERAVEDMLAQTSTRATPWKMIAANNKRHARVAVLKHYCKRLQQRLRDD